MKYIGIGIGNISKNYPGRCDIGISISPLPFISISIGMNPPGGISSSFIQH